MRKKNIFVYSSKRCSDNRIERFLSIINKEKPDKMYYFWNNWSRKVASKVGEDILKEQISHSGSVDDAGVNRVLSNILSKCEKVIIVNDEKSSIVSRYAKIQSVETINVSDFMKKKPARKQTQLF